MVTNLLGLLLSRRLPQGGQAADGRVEEQIASRWPARLALDAAQGQTVDNVTPRKGGVEVDAIHQGLGPVEGPGLAKGGARGARAGRRPGREAQSVDQSSLLRLSFSHA